MATLKSDQLRVRLTKETRLALEQYAASKGGNATVSSVLREFVQWLLNPDKYRRPCSLSSEADQALVSLAKACGRSEEQTLEECLLAIKEMVDNEKVETPLIVQEIRLRQNYK